MRLRPLALVAALAGLAALAPVTGARASGPARPGSYRGIEYRHGKPTDFLTMRFSVSPDGRHLRSLTGMVDAECTVAGGTSTFMEFSLGYPGQKTIAAGGRLNAHYLQVTHTHGATVRRTLTLTGTFRGGRASGKLAFQSAIANSGPGCEFDADWRATRSR